MQINDRYLEHFQWNYPNVIAKRPHWLFGNIGSDNGLEQSGTKPLTELTLTKFYDAIWHHQATMC